jgi:hypothetical protein
VTKFDQNRAIYIYEGFYLKGNLAKETNNEEIDKRQFGRHFKTDGFCYIGYFNYD